jgi:hypothetical protein
VLHRLTALRLVYRGFLNCAPNGAWRFISNDNYKHFAPTELTSQQRFINNVEAHLAVRGFSTFNIFPRPFTFFPAKMKHC